jgi:hypothetical protein
MIALMLLMLARTPVLTPVHDVTGNVFKTAAMRHAPAPFRREMTIVVVRPVMAQPEPFSFTVHAR